VPVVFAVVFDTVYSAVDAKPKSTTDLRRLANVRANPRVSLLADEYADDDWGTLWWARADGAARVLTADPGPDFRSPPLNQHLADQRRLIRVVRDVAHDFLGMRTKA